MKALMQRIMRAFTGDPGEPAMVVPLTDCPDWRAEKP